MKRVRGLATMLALLLVAIVIGESPAFKQVESAILEHQRLLLIITIGLLVVGFTIVMGGALSLAGAFGEPMSHGDVEEMMRQHRNQMAWPYTWRKQTYRVFGTAVGREAESKVSFREIKEAWARRAWKSESRWRHAFVMAAGGTMMFFGLFGLSIVIGPPAVKILFAAGMIYAVVRTASGFRRA